jgi:hypothetical protein
MKLLKDHPASTEYALQSGKLIQNFGVVELTSYRWIAYLSQSAVAVEISRELPLAKRIDVILRLMDRGTRNIEKREQAVLMWRQLRDKGCEVRNSIAHGTVGFGFEGEPANADPTFSGVLKLKRWTDCDELISLDELKNAVDVTANIVEQLNEILESETTGEQELPSGHGSSGG